MKDFKTYREKKQWNTWYRTFVATARAQGLNNVLDPNYTPTTDDEKALFDVSEEYTFAVLSQCLQESQAADLVYEYSSITASHPGNTQKLLHELVRLMTTGMLAMTQRSMLETKLINLRLNSKWNTGVVSFLVHVKHLIRDLQEL